MKNVVVFIIIILLFTIGVNAQEHPSEKNISEISKTYSKKLYLTKNQSEKFNQILLV